MPVLLVRHVQKGNRVHACKYYSLLYLKIARCYEKKAKVDVWQLNIFVDAAVCNFVAYIPS
jgi:hypothetical protein